MSNEVESLIRERDSSRPQPVEEKCIGAGTRYRLVIICSGLLFFSLVVGCVPALRSSLLHPWRGNLRIARLDFFKKYSQYGQDAWLTSVFGNAQEQNRFYLDIGAHDGHIISNTQALDERGWKGVCVEPLPRHFQDRTCQLVKTVLTNHTGDTITFEDCTITGTDGGDGGLSGIKGLGDYSGTTARKQCTPVSFQTERTDDFMARVAIPRIIDYVCLDVEGAEEMILSAFPFDKHCVRAWTIERPTSACKGLLTRQGCVMSKSIGEDKAYTCPCNPQPNGTKSLTLDESLASKPAAQEAVSDVNTANTDATLGSRSLPLPPTVRPNANSQSAPLQATLEQRSMTTSLSIPWLWLSGMAVLLSQQFF